MPLNDIPFLYIIADLMRDADLRQRFNRNPKAVIKEYGLDATGDDQQEQFLTMDKVKIAAKLQALFLNFEMRKGEFPPPGPDYLTEAGGIDPMYPTPKPGVFRARPTHPPAGASFEFVVFGQSFVNVQLQLKRILPAAPPAVAQLSPPNAFGTFRACGLQTVASPPTGEPAFVSGHKYQIVVMSPANTPSAVDVGPGPNYPVIIA